MKTLLIVTFHLQGLELKGKVFGANPATLNHAALNSKHITAAVDLAVEALKSRFISLLSDTKDGAPSAVQCFRVFNHDAWPETNSQLLDYGIEEITILLNHFDVTLKK